MPAIIEIPSALQRFTNSHAQFNAPGSNVGEAMNALINAHGELKQHLFDEQGNLRSFINIYVNDEDIRAKGLMEAKLNEGDSIQIVPSIAGGNAMPSATH